MNCGERTYAAARYAASRWSAIDLHQVSPGDIEHVNVGRRRADGRRRHRPGQPEDRRPRARAPRAPTPSTCVQQTDCTLRLLRRRRQHRPVLDLRPARPRPPASRSTPTRRRPACRASPARPPATSGTSTTPGYGTHTGFNGASIVERQQPARTAAGHHDRCGRPGHRPEVPRLERLHPAQLPAPERQGVPQRRRALAGQRQHPAGHRGGLRADRLQPRPARSRPGGSSASTARPNAIVPLDKVELSDLGTYPLPVGAFCSSHWFDFHPSGHRRGRASTAAAPSSSTYATRRT